MGAVTDGAEIVRLAKEHAELKPVADAVEALEKARAERPDLEAMAASDDREMSALAREELEALDKRLPDLERAIALMLAPRIWYAHAHDRESPKRADRPGARPPSGHCGSDDIDSRLPM